MATYRRASKVDVPFEDVWQCQIRPAGLEATTPGFVNLSVTAVRDADGSSVPDPLETALREGWEVDVRTRPFGCWTDEWTSEILSVERREGRARFVDRMTDGPFPQWEHSHAFESLNAGRTRIVDEVNYRLPPTALPNGVDHLAKIGLVPTFWYRHRRTAALG